jgi:hypothetical protein
LSLAVRKSSWPRWRTSVFCAERWKLQAEVELLERLSGGEARLLDPALAAVRVTGGDLGCEQRLGELLVAPLVGAGTLGQPGQRPRGGRRLQRPKQKGELGLLGHAGISWS